MVIIMNIENKTYEMVVYGSSNVALAGEYIPERVTNYVNQFNGYGRKTAEGILEMSRIICEVDKLNTDDRVKFYNSVGIQKGDSSLKKYRVIGSQYDRLMNYIDKLSSNWTTIYNLATIPSDDFIKYVEEGKIFPSMKGTDVIALIGKNSTKPNPKENEIVVTIKYKGVPNKTLTKSLANLIALAKNQGFEVSESNGVKNIFDFGVEPDVLCSFEQEAA